MRNIEIFDEENQILIEDEYTIGTYTIDQQKKQVSLSSSVKDDVFYNYLVWEYKLSTDPIRLQMRLIEKSSEPPHEYQVRDGVVLESDMKKETEFMSDMIEEQISSLRSEVEWNAVELTSGNFAVNFSILSKHPEIIASDEYRKIVRQNIERIKLGVAKTENRIKTERSDLEIKSYGDERGFSFIENEEIKKEESAWKSDISSFRKKKEDWSQDATQYEQKLNRLTDYTNSLFSKDSKSYVGISEYEFRSSSEIIEHLEKLLEVKTISNKELSENKANYKKGIVLSLLLTLFLSWVVSWFVDINPILIFLIVQVITFLQSIIGNWIGKFFE